MQYRVKEKSFINGSLLEEGAIVELPAKVKPCKNLEPVKTATPQRQQQKEENTNKQTQTGTEA